MNILRTKRFARMFKQLPGLVQEKAVQKEGIFKKYPFSKSLKTHKLKGKFTGCYAFSIDYNYRIIFKLLDENTAAFMIIGDHSIYE